MQVDPQTGDQQTTDEPQNPEDVMTDDLKTKVKAAQKKEEVKKQQTIAQFKTTDDLQNKITDLTEALQRCVADQQNFKRRAEEDRVKFIKFANAELLKALLPMIDNFDRACQQISDHLTEEPWVKGVVTSHDELMRALAKMGVHKMETVGQMLDTTKHEAVMQGFGPKDQILEEMEAGYIYNDVTLKPAKVKVGDGHKK